MPGAAMSVVQTPFFFWKAATLLDEDQRSDLVVFLGMNPEAGRTCRRRAATKAERNEFKALVPLLVKKYAKGKTL
jgi:hypothetical protein